MKTLRSFITMLLYISLCMLPAQAQHAPDKQQEAQATNTIAQDVLIITQQEQVRFTARKGGTEMQLQIFDLTGQLVHDSGAVTGPELTWSLRKASGEAVKSGLYLYRLSVKEAGAETAQVRRGHFIVDRNGQMVTSQNDSEVVAELTAAKNESEPKTETNVVAALPGSGAGHIAWYNPDNNLGYSAITQLGTNIGLGTFNPTRPLEIANGKLRFSSNLGDIEFTETADLIASATTANPAPTGSAFRVDVGTNLTRAFTVLNNGHVGIGTPSPEFSTQLHVIANSYVGVRTESPNGISLMGLTNGGIGVFAESGPDGYAGLFNGKVLTSGDIFPVYSGLYSLGQPDNLWAAVYALNGTIQTSDARLKRGVTDLRYGLRELMQLRPVAFEWKDHNDGQQHLGLIAQETEKIIPEAVARAKDVTAPLGMNYTTLIPVVIKAIQEQQNTVTTLKNENEALQQQNTTLQQQNADLDARLRALEQAMQQLMGQSRNQASEIKRQ